MRQAIIFDFNRTLYDPSVGNLFPDTLPCLKDMPRGILLGLITTTSAGRDEDCFRRLNLSNYFNFILIVDQKNPSHFSQFCTQFQLNPADVWVVGDHLDEEIIFGNTLGMITVWLSRNQQTPDGQIPSYVIHSLSELCPLIERNIYVGV